MSAAASRPPLPAMALLAGLAERLAEKRAARDAAHAIYIGVPADEHDDVILAALDAYNAQQAEYVRMLERYVDTNERIRNGKGV